jgi:hypothetical protein
VCVCACVCVLVCVCVCVCVCMYVYVYICIGTWFFQKNDGTMYPYTEELAGQLTNTFLRGGGGGSCGRVEVGNHRYVCRAVGGEYAQEHSQTHTGYERVPVIYLSFIFSTLLVLLI